MPEGGGGEFQTVSLWFMNKLGRVPAETARISAGEWMSEVLDKALATWNLPMSPIEWDLARPSRWQSIR